MLILGLDPGTINHGFALLYNDNNPKLTKYGNIKVAKTKTLPDRLHIIHEKLEELRQNKIPFIIRRPISNHYEYWKLEDLKIV